MKKNPESVLLREYIFEICWDVFKVSEKTLTLPNNNTRVKLGGGRRKGISYKDTFVKYFFINWLTENQELTRREVGTIFNTDHSTISFAIKKSNIYVKNRDIEFCAMLDKFNNALTKKGIETVKCDIQIKRGIKSRLTKEEKYNLEFMLNQEIAMNKLAEHFHVSLHTIRKFKNELKDYN